MRIRPIPLHKIRLEKKNFSTTDYPKDHLIWEFFRFYGDTVVVPARSDYFRTRDGGIRDIFIVNGATDGSFFTVNRSEITMVHESNP